ARDSSVACEFPQIFHVAVARFSWSLSQAFCSAPRRVCGGAFFCGLAMRPSLNWRSAGGLPPLKARPPSSTCMTFSGNMPLKIRPIAKLAERVVAVRVAAAMAVQVGDDQVEVLAVAQRPIRFEAVDRCEVVRLDAEAVVVELLDRDVLDGRRSELLERSARWSDARGEIFEPRLIGGDLDGLARLLERTRLHDALPAHPRKLVIVPHGDERPARAPVLQVRDGDVALVDGAISVERQRNVEVANLVSVGEACDLVDRAVVASLRLFRVLDHFVDEVAEVQDESELSVLRRALVLEDHPAIGVELAFIDGL